jgi:hypothetical protein
MVIIDVLPCLQIDGLPIPYVQAQVQGRILRLVPLLP